MKFVITGSTGMIGLTLTKYLISLHHEVIMFVREKTSKASIIPNSPLITVVKCDLDNLSSYSSEQTADYFIHLGWDKTIGDGRNDVYIQNQNVKYTLDAIKLAKRMNCKKFIGAGSQAEYGISNEKLSSQTPCNPFTGYGVAKYCASKFSKILCDQLGLEYNWLRILSIYGANDNPNTLISYTINSMMNNQSPDLTLCEQDWDYLYVKDLARAIYLTMLNGVNGKVYPVGSGKTRKLKEYVLILKESLNQNVKVNFGTKPYAPNQVMYLCADIDELIKDTGFIPKYTFEVGIKETIEYYKNQDHLRRISNDY